MRPPYLDDPTMDQPMCAACSGVSWLPGQFAVIQRAHIEARHPELLKGNTMNSRSHAVTNAAYSLRRQIEDAEAKLRLLEMIPTRDDFAHGTAVRVVVRPRYGNSDPLTYLLLKIIDENVTGHGDKERWYFTGSLSGRGNSGGSKYCRWDQLVSWLVNDVVLESWEILVPLDLRAVTSTQRHPISPGDEIPYNDDRA